MSAQVAPAPSFGRIRSMLWPIYTHELRKFIPMLLIYSLIVFNYTLLRIAKDTMVITAPNSGAQSIPFIKVWGILPTALLFTFLFTRLSNSLNRQKVFYTMMGIFLGFFFLFATVLYPFRDILHPNAWADSMQAILPKGLGGLVAIFRNWTFTLFYVMSELWGTFIMTVLFWGFANEISSVKDAKRHYAILGLGANFVSILSGQVAVSLPEYATRLSLFPFTDKWGQVVIFLTFIVVCIGLVATGLFAYLNHVIDKQHRPTDSVQQAAPKKIKMGMRENFAYLAKSRYLIAIAIIVLTYNISLNMVEVIWKDQLKSLYPNPSDFQAYYGKVNMYMGVTSTLVSLLICGSVIRKFGWRFSALITPLILTATGILFFIFTLLKDSSQLTLICMTLFGLSPLAFSVFLGGIQNCLTRASKYTFFDATKEMAFIPLSPESKLKGKAAIDGVGSRLGKSGGSVVHQFLLLMFGSVSMSTPIVAVILGLVALAWILAINSLGKKFNDLTYTSEKLDLETTDSSTPYSSGKKPQEVLL